MLPYTFSSVLHSEDGDEKISSIFKILLLDNVIIYALAIVFIDSNIFYRDVLASFTVQGEWCLFLYLIEAEFKGDVQFTKVKIGLN